MVFIYYILHITIWSHNYMYICVYKLHNIIHIQNYKKLTA